MTSPSVTPEPQKRPPHLIYWFIAFALAGVLLYFSLRGIDWAQVWTVLKRADLRLIAITLLISTVALFLRAFRWRILLQAQGAVAVADAFWATAAGYFGNNFLPARAGELVRTMMISSSSALGRMFVLTTALTERLADAITLVLISSVVLLSLPVKPGWFDGAAKPFALIGIGGALAILVIPKLETFWLRLLKKCPIPEGICNKLVSALEQINIGLRTFHDPARITGFIGLTMVIWFSDAAATLVGMRALGLTTTIPIALLLITGLGLGSALPSTPGYVGIYQFVAVSVLVPFGFSKTNAIAYILLFQALQYVMIGFWGLIGIARARRKPLVKDALASQ